jgi:predicted acetyltransferase
VTIALHTPTLAALPQLVSALERGWSPDNVRGAVAAGEMLARIATDAPGFVAAQTDPQAKAGPVTLPDGSTVARLPGRTFWIWDEALDAFCGSINLRWPRDGGPLPPHVLGHVGYAVVPWHRGRGVASAALRAVLAHARALGLPFVDVTCDVDNAASIKVIERAGGVRGEPFVKPPAFGSVPGLRYRIALG